MISDMQKMVLLSISAIMLLIWIVSTEITSFIASKGRYIQDKPAMLNNAVPVHMIQVLVFTVLAAYNMTSSLLPMYIIRYSSKLPGAWCSICATLPITVNLFIMGFMALFCVRKPDDIYAARICFYFCRTAA